MREGLTGSRSIEGWRKVRGRRPGTPKTREILRPLEYGRTEVGSGWGGN